MTLFASRTALVASLPALLFACSFINSFDDVKQSPDTGGAPGTGGKGSNGGTSSSGTTALGGEPTTEGGEPNAPTAGSGGEPSVTLPTTGLVVVAGSDLSEGDASSGVVATLDPSSGEVLSRETLSGAAVVSVGYDGRTNLWYIFTSSAFPADPNSKADLQVRSYSDATNKWTVVSKATALPPPQPNGVMVLNDRLAYLSYEIDGGLTKNAVTVLDTSNPKKVTPIAYDQPALDGEALGFVGSRGAPGDDTAMGGTVAVALANGCTGVALNRSCSALTLTPIFVGDAISAGLAVSFGAFGGVPGFASARSEQKAFMALPSKNLGENVRVFAFDPRTPSADSSQLAPSKARHVGGVTYADCEQVTAIDSVDAGMLFVLTGAGLAASGDLSRQGQLVGYEPFQQRLIVPFNPESAVYPDVAQNAGGAGNTPAIDAYKATRSGANVTLTKLDESQWSAPADIGVDVVATRFPTTFACPK